MQKLDTLIFSYVLSQMIAERNRTRREEYLHSSLGWMWQIVEGYAYPSEWLKEKTLEILREFQVDSEMIHQVELFPAERVWEEFKIFCSEHAFSKFRKQ